MKSIQFFFIAALLVMISPGCKDQQTSSEENQPPVEVEPDYMSEGKEIAARTFGVLSSTLQQAISTDGVPGAISLCNLKAYPLVDSLSEAFDVEIRRTSLKTRNPRNNPTMQETVVLDRYQETVQNGGELKPLVETLGDGRHAFYAPITVNAFCLKCHGVIGETLDERHYALIRERYPNDKAIDYADGDLRGIWSIVFED